MEMGQQLAFMLQERVWEMYRGALAGPRQSDVRSAALRRWKPAVKYGNVLFRLRLISKRKPNLLQNRRIAEGA